MYLPTRKSFRLGNDERKCYLNVARIHIFIYWDGYKPGLLFGTRLLHDGAICSGANKESMNGFMLDS